MELWEILVPCTWNDGRPIRTRHHKEWDKWIRKQAGGLTVLKPAKGQWLNGPDLFEERMIPVRIATDSVTMSKICDFTARHYRQLAIMCYKVSTEVWIRNYDSSYQCDLHSPRLDLCSSARSPNGASS